MYVILILGLLAVGGALVMKGASTGRRRWVAVGASVIALTLLFFAFLSFWGEYLWFAELGYTSRFWTVVLARVGLGLAGAGVGALVVYLLTLPIRGRWTRGLPVLAGSLVGASIGATSWSVVLRYLHAIPTEIHEPILGRDEGFYLFKLPLYDVVYGLLLLLTLISLVAAVVGAYLASEPESVAPVALPEDAPLGDDSEESVAPAPDTRPSSSPAAHRPLLVALGGLALVLAWGQYLATFHLMYSRFGVVNGPGWTDVHVRLPAHYVVGAVLLAVGIALLVPAVGRALHRRSGAGEHGGFEASLRMLAVPVSVVGAAWIGALFVLPALVQWLKVHPNEISVERPYLINSIAFTRRGFRLHEVEDSAFPVSDQLTRETIAANQDVLSEIRLWDPRAINGVFQQFQAIRLYYNLSEVDVDRYVMGDRYRQVMLAPREMSSSNLPREHRSFVNQHFKYTHGYGLAMASASDFKDDGLPNLLVKDIPPAAAFPELAVTRPEIYYGEQTTGYVVGNSKEQEFDYPSGEENVYARYTGRGGVPLQGFFRKFLFGWKLGGTAFLMSTYPTADSRVLFRREIRERVQTVAPFLELDRDPYITVVGGRLFWIIDAYTTSTYYPYSEPFSSSGAPAEAPQAGSPARSIGYFDGANYVRNSVKAVVDAFDGSVKLYVFDPDDPIIRVWSRIFPELFHARGEMPSELRAHVRYPEDFLVAQGLVFTKYHMTDPEVFYNQEDLWVQATERDNGDVQAVDPYYVMWKPTGTRGAEFTLIQPFTPKNRQVLISWIAGMCDGENYGRLLAYRFPKEKRVLGTQQMDAKIDQDPVLTARLALWSQRGTSVIRGNALVIPIDDTLLYVEPIFIRAASAAYPELRVVVVMHGDQMRYAGTFDAALRGLLEGEGERSAGLGVGSPELDEALRRANQAFESYLRLSGEKRFAEAARELESLSRALKQRTETPVVPEVE